MYIDQHEFIAMKPTFNQKKFYCGRAVELHGHDEDGGTVNGVFLIKYVDSVKIGFVNSIGKELHLHLSSFVDEIDDSDGEVYNKTINIIFFGEDRT